MSDAKPTLLELLARGKQEQHRARELKRVRRVGAPTGLDINELAKKIEAELLWRSTALVTVFNEQRCNSCGSTNIAHCNTMVAQEHIREIGAKRMLRSLENHPDLPKRSELWLEYIEVCFQCYDEEATPLPTITPLPLLERSDDTEESQQ